MTREAVSAFVKLMNKLDRVKKQLRPATTSAKRPTAPTRNRPPPTSAQKSVSRRAR